MQLIIILWELCKPFDKCTQVDVGILHFSRAFDTVPHEQLLGKSVFVESLVLLTPGYKLFSLAGIRLLLWMGRSLTRRQSSLGYLRERFWVCCSSSSTSATWLIKYPPVPVYTCFKTTAWYIVKLTLLKTKLSYNKTLYAYRHGLSFGVCDSTHPNVISCISAGVNHLLNYMSFVLSPYKMFPVPSIKASCTIGSDLKWSKYVNNIAARANGTLHFTHRNLKYCPQSARKTAYCSLVRSTLEYCSGIWNPHLHKNITTLEKVNRCAVRVVFNKS